MIHLNWIKYGWAVRTSMKMKSKEDLEPQKENQIPIENEETRLKRRPQ